MKISTLTLSGLALLASLTPIAVEAQTQNEETRETHSRLQVGGYGEVAFTRNFYSDSPYRYSSASTTKTSTGHGRFDIPHAVVYLSYDFGKGWKMSSEIEFEHGGSGGAYEKEYEEGGEWEQETEKGGEVELEQFWLQKTFFPALNIKAGHIVVPVGLTNVHHEPTEYFTVYRPEGEATIFPCTWHQTGISVWGRPFSWLRYEAQFLPGLDGLRFSKDTWIQDGAGSPFELEVSNKYAVAARLDFYPIQGLRIGASGYYGHSINNSYQTMTGKNYKAKGAVTIGSIDVTYNNHGFIFRGSFDYGHLGDAEALNQLATSQSNNSPYARTHVSSEAMAGGAELGYDFFSLIPGIRKKDQKCYIFGRYEYYDSYHKAVKVGGIQTDYPWAEKHRIAAGLNYYPIPQLVIKGEYSHRFLNSAYNDEPSVSLGVAYAGFFTK